MAKSTCIVTSILQGIAILLLLGAAFDVLPYADNMIMFIAIGLFIVTGILAKIAKSAAGTGSCCK